ncbi:MAG: hypothetical protein H0Z33_16305 [Bacillaceae bacterium]|nr:hypothetical protein [Bacillaceae bacterium]
MLISPLTQLPVSDNLLNRQRLFTALDAGSHKPLITVTGGTGFGKSSLIASYIQHHQCDYLWYTLTEPRTSFSDLAISIDHELDRLNKPDCPHRNATNDMGLSLMSMLREWPKKLWIVVDRTEYLSLDDADLSLFMSLIHNVSPHVSIILIGRTLPSRLPFSRWKMQGKLLSFSQNKLAFTLEETREYFESRHLPLAEHEVERAYEETEGWPAGISLYAEAVKDLPRVEREKFWLNFHENEDVYQYMANEVVADLSEELRAFLYYSSICRELDPTVLEALIPDINVKDCLTQLHDYKLFVTIDASGTLRLHELFRRFLYKKMTDEWGVDKVRDLHRQLAILYRDKYRFFDAFAQSLAAGHDELTAEMMTRMAERYKPEHFLQLMDGWLETLSPSLNLSSTSLFLFRCIPVKFSEKLIDPLTAFSQRYNEKSPATYLNLQHRLASIYFYKGALDQVVAAYEESLAYARELQDRRMIALNLSMLAQTYRFMNEEKKAVSLAREALLVAEQDGFEHAQMHALWTLSEVMMHQGELETGRRFAEQAIDVSQKCDEASVIYPTCTLSQYYRKTGRIQEAFKWVEKAIQHAERFEMEADLGWAYCELALCHRDNHDLPKAEKYMRRADEWFQDFCHHRCIIQLMLADILGQQGKWDEANERLSAVRTTIEKYDYHWIRLPAELSVMKDVDSTPRLKINMMGPLVLRHGDQAIKIRRKSSLRLLLLLASQYDRRWSKEEIIGKLFPDDDGESASNQFYVALSVLRKSLEPHLKKGRKSKYIHYDGSHYQFITRDVDLDIKEMEDLLADSEGAFDRRKIDRMTQLYAGDLLEEYPHEEFLYERRNELRQACLSYLKSAALTFQKQGKFEAATALFEKLIQIEPYEEQYYFLFIEHLVSSGYQGKAQKVGNKAVQFMEDELGIPIREEIESLLASAMNQSSSVL